MAKKKNESNDTWAELAASLGGDLLSANASSKYYIDTGSLAINFVCSCRFIGGGIPSGKITEVYGPSSSAKTLLAMNFLNGVQKLSGVPGILDCENSSNAEFAENASHIDANRVIRATPETLERAFSKTRNLIKMSRERFGKYIPIGIVYDSISVSPCERELKENDLPDNYTAADWKKIVKKKEQPGERAKICSAELRKIQSILEKNDATLFIINQTREKIGIMYGSNEATAGGGNALPFYASLRLRTQAQRKIVNKRLDKSIGVNLKVENKKNRSCRPFIKTSGVKLYFDAGIDPLSGLLTLLIEDERIIQKGAGNYYVAEKYLPSSVSEYTFKASKTEEADNYNIVPEKVVLDCPALIDAISTEEVEKYISDFKLAMGAINPDDIQEVGMTSGDKELDELIELDEESLEE